MVGPPAEENRPDSDANHDAAEFQPADVAGEHRAETDVDEKDLSPAELKSALHEAQDRLLRLQAELENQRRRSRRELDDAVRYANLPLMRDLLPVMDNIDRAIEAAEKSPDGAGLLEGVKMMADQLKSLLQKFNCQPIEALGQPFDPHLHEAIAKHPSSEHTPGNVMMTVQTGYQLHDRVVRPTQVIVAGEAASEQQPDEE